MNSVSAMSYQHLQLELFKIKLNFFLLLFFSIHGITTHLVTQARKHSAIANLSCPCVSHLASEQSTPSSTQVLSMSNPCPTLTACALSGSRSFPFLQHHILLIGFPASNLSSHPFNPSPSFPILQKLDLTIPMFLLNKTLLTDNISNKRAHFECFICIRNCTQGLFIYYLI